MFCPVNFSINFRGVVKGSGGPSTSVPSPGGVTVTFPVVWTRTINHYSNRSVTWVRPVLTIPYVRSVLKVFEEDLNKYRFFLSFWGRGHGYKCGYTDNSPCIFRREPDTIVSLQYVGVG